ncbi:MAG: UDP-N-acetylmuramoylalanyl-D-glutamyl-2,6-diaminopimelate--D-alanyl-D-alanine ligase, partial [Nitrospirota bacterium]|nr:UDP-N-acetylmuramoylalanyl-D-glutamyl-2,6-diaminopimelate--D-alanyl-D-alanine ligase [Nitrospirota bacterium]
GVSIDSRTVLPGELFIALQGPLHDGHDFVRAALDRGAAALVAHRPHAVSADAPLVVVDDTMAALTTLGQAARARSQARVAAITGSVGKTGTKEALRLALAAQGPTHASAASHNNHWGVPLSLAREPHGTAYGIYELGMNAPGEIAALTRLVRPHVALITTIEAAHLGYFPSVAAIAEAKGEIFEGLEPGGIAVLNADNAHFARLKELAKAAGCERVIAFGSSELADAKLLEARRDPSGSDVVMWLDGREIAYRMGAPGQHWVINSLAVIAGAVALGADGEAAAQALAGFAAPKGRGQRHRIELAGGAIDLIDESYNANPASMRAALSLLEGRSGRTIAALGDMLELGELAGEFHAELAEPIAAHGVDLVFTSGASMRHLHDALPPARRGEHAESAAELLPILRAVLQPGDTLLVKGSLGSAMGPIVEALLAADGETQTARAGGG